MGTSSRADENKRLTDPILDLREAESSTGRYIRYQLYDNIRYIYITEQNETPYEGTSLDKCERVELIINLDVLFRGAQQVSQMHREGEKRKKIT